MSHGSGAERPAGAVLEPPPRAAESDIDRVRSPVHLPPDLRGRERSPGVSKFHDLAGAGRELLQALRERLPPKAPRVAGLGILRGEEFEDLGVQRTGAGTAAPIALMDLHEGNGAGPGWKVRARLEPVGQTADGQEDFL